MNGTVLVGIVPFLIASDVRFIDGENIINNSTYGYIPAVLHAYNKLKAGKQRGVSTPTTTTSLRGAWQSCE